MKWKIWKSGLGLKDYIVVEADSFDEALAIARKKDPEYHSGQVLEDKEIK
jgi:hypothetical protein